MASIFPISTPKLPNTPTDLAGEVIESILEDYDNYFNETVYALNVVVRRDFTPDLAQVDAQVESIIIYDPVVTALSELIGSIWNLIEVLEMNGNSYTFRNPEVYTLVFLPESYISIQVD